ncbi:unnamed protein product [Ectocarpus sp. CCAP 1310/34]|nr:unnamed protein product [Ectocarpus sp. CCAP 1310/34]
MAEEEDDSLDALEYELNQMGLSVEDLQPPEDGQFDRRAMARVESARIMSRRFIERDRVKDRISAQTKGPVGGSVCRQRNHVTNKENLVDYKFRGSGLSLRSDLLVAWVADTGTSEIAIMAVGLTTREKRKEEAKNNIILQALTESSDLEALRREKRAIIEEERCLKALMDIEKSSGHRKAQMLAALRAEKQRHAAKADYRRRRFTDALESHFEKEAEVLREKHGVAPKATNTFSSFDG